MSIASHRTAIKALADFAGIRAYDYAPKSLSPSCAVVGFPVNYNPHDTFTTTAMTLPVALYVPYAANRAAEDALEALIDSLVTAVEGNDAYACSAVRDFGVLENAAGQPTALSCTVDFDCL